VPKYKGKNKMEKIQKITIAQIKAIEGRQHSIVNRAAINVGLGEYTEEELYSFKKQEKEITDVIKLFASSLSAKDYPILDIAEVRINSAYLVSKETGNNINYIKYKPGHDKVIARLNNEFQTMIDRLYLEGLSDKIKEDYKHLLEI
jgi:hypothetical protein